MFSLFRRGKNPSAVQGGSSEGETSSEDPASVLLFGEANPAALASEDQLELLEDHFSEQRWKFWDLFSLGCPQWAESYFYIVTELI
jgi:hypothetical protein